MRIAIIALALGLAAPALATSAGKDPRVCVSGSPAKQCAQGWAVYDLRLFMARRTQVAHWDADITCTGSKAWLVWRCTFRNSLGSGAALITFGKAPTFVQRVVLKSYTPA